MRQSIKFRSLVVSLAVLATAVASQIEAVEVVADAFVVEQQLVDAGANIDQQLRAQFEPVVKVELSFAIRACKLEGEDRKKLIAAGDKWLDQYVKDSQKRQPNRGQLRVFVGGPRQAGQDSDPRRSIAQGIAGVVNSVVTPEQAAAYRQELSHRDSAYRDAIAATLVVRMDEKLALSAEQRQKLAESFATQWDDKWAPPLELFMYNNEMWPAIPDKVVSPHLTPAQWEIWTRIAKNAQNVRFGWGGENGQVIDDVEFEKPAAEEPVAEQAVEGAFQLRVAPAAKP
jgi:hypothetical protein